MKYGLLYSNGNYSAIRFDNGMENTISAIVLVASSKKTLINKIKSEGYVGYLNDGLIHGLNDGEHCEKYSLGV